MFKISTGKQVQTIYRKFQHVVKAKMILLANTPNPGFVHYKMSKPMCASCLGSSLTVLTQKKYP